MTLCVQRGTGEGYGRNKEEVKKRANQSLCAEFFGG